MRAPRRLLLLLLSLLLLVAAAVAGLAASSTSSPALEVRGRHATARADAATGRLAVGFPSTTNEREDDETLTIPLGGVGFRHRGRWLSPLGGGLVLAGVSIREHGADGSDDDDNDDALGPSTVLSVRWRSEEPPHLPFHTDLRLYHDNPALAFEQRLPLGTEGAATEDQDQVITSFPAFATSAGSYLGPRGFLTYAHNMACPDGVLFCTPVGVFQGAAATLSESCGQAGGVPLVVFGKSAAAAAVPSSVVGPTLVISPMDHFMAANVRYDNGTGWLQYGVQGKVDALPAGFVFRTVLYIHRQQQRQHQFRDNNDEDDDDSITSSTSTNASGSRSSTTAATTTTTTTTSSSSSGGGGSGQVNVNAALEGWGRLLRRCYGRGDAAREKDVTADYLSYYTDNGAYYYYVTEANKSYEATLLDLWAYAQGRGIPYRSLQIDSWWYFKGRDNGVKRWDGRPDIFPSGLEAFHDQLGADVPIIAHNRWWSVETDYATQNGGDYAFAIEQRQPLPDGDITPEEAGTTAAMRRRRRRRRLFGDDISPLPYGAALPLEERFWVDLFSEARRWGLYIYEQDWLHNEFLSLNATLATVDGARRWLRQMGRAAERVGIHIQYCMAFPRFYLQALEIPAVKQIRVSDDYGPSTRPDQWALGDTALLAHSLGLVPFKDVFWSVVQQDGNPYGPETREMKPNLEAAIATLSAGPVAPGDKIGLEDRELIMRSCNDDGLLLKPSRPITTIDAVHRWRAFAAQDEEVFAQGPQGMVMATYALLPFTHGDGDGGFLRFDIVLAAALNASYSLGPSDLVPRAACHTASSLRTQHQQPRLVAFPSPFSSGGGGNGSSNSSSGGQSFFPSSSFTHVPIQAFDDGRRLSLAPCDRRDFGLWYVAPALPVTVSAPRGAPPLLRRRHDQQFEGERSSHRRVASLVLLGEVGKWVPHSPQRFARLALAEAGEVLVLSLRGKPGEKVEVGVAVWDDAVNDGQPTEVAYVQCVVTARGRATARVRVVVADDDDDDVDVDGRDGQGGKLAVAWACQSSA